MPATQLTVQQSVITGLEAVFSSANVDGNFFINDGKTFIEVVNGSGADITATIDSPETCNQGGTHDVAVVVTAGERRHIGPFAQSRFNNDNGYTQITYSGVTTLTIAAIKL